jgi:release factor glutamine methyltransferase
VAAADEAEELLAAAPDDDTLERWLTQREAGVPLAWLTGRVEFAGRNVRVDTGIYVPRRQTEELAHRATRALASAVECMELGSDRLRAADLCTGAGAVAAHLAAEVPEATVVGADIDPAAAACARCNGVVAVVGDVGGALRSGVFDVVTAVAPYVPSGALPLLPADVQRYEPGRALDGGEDGLDTVRAVVADAARLLRPGGWLLLEVGGEQDETVGPLLAESGFTCVETWADDDGDLRGMAAKFAT